MRRPSVEVTVAGQSFRVVASEGEEAVRRYAEQVQERLQQLGGGRQSVHPQAMLLAAMALAHDLEQEKARHAETKQQAAQAVESMLRRVDDALGGVDDDGRALASWQALAEEERAALAVGGVGDSSAEESSTQAEGVPASTSPEETAGPVESDEADAPVRQSQLVAEGAPSDPDADFVSVRRNGGSATHTSGSSSR